MQLPQREKEVGMRKVLGVSVLLLVWGLAWAMFIGFEVEGVGDRVAAALLAGGSLLMGMGFRDLSRRGVDKGSAGVLEKS